MRIRKNAKISAFLQTNTNLSTASNESLLQRNLCQLNQSPWDIITFPSSDSSSSLHQFDDNEVYCNVNLARNRSSVDSIGDFQSVASKASPDGEYDKVNGTRDDYSEILGFKEEVNEIEEEIVLCVKRDEKGWQCGRVVKNGNTTCDRHLSELQNHAFWTTKKKYRPVSQPTAGCRPRRTKKRPTTNPYDFYYYSGFGPPWGKKRGAVGTVSNAYEQTTTLASNSNKGYGTSGVNTDIDLQEGKGTRFGPEMSKVGPTNAESDYIGCRDDNNVDEKGKMGIIGKKRGRKPIKARSLRSLM